MYSQECMAFLLQKFLMKKVFMGLEISTYKRGKKAWKSFYFGGYLFCSAGPYEISGH